MKGEVEVSNIPPPPIPNSSSSRTNIPSKGGSSRPAKFAKEDYEYPSKLPIAIALIAAILSLVSWKFQSKSIFVSALGYVLTPIVILICLGVDNYIQRIRTSRQLYFISDARFGKILRIISIIGLVLSLPHVGSLANAIAAWIAERFPGIA